MGRNFKLSRAVRSCYGKSFEVKVCMIPLLSACRFVEFYSSVICHVLVLCFSSFLLQDMFLGLQAVAFEGQNMMFTVNVLLTCILYCDAEPGYD